MAFVAGILNPILDSDEFKKLEKQNIAPKMRQKLKVLNELVHGIIRSQNFPEVNRFLSLNLGGNRDWTRIMEGSTVLDDPDGPLKNSSSVSSTSPATHTGWGE